MEVEAVLHEGMWYVAIRTPGAPTDLCSAQQACDRAMSAEKRGDTERAKQLRNVAADVKQRNAKLGAR